MNCRNKLEIYLLEHKHILNKFNLFLDKDITRKVCFYLIIIISFFLIYLLNITHPLFGDDWAYSMLPDGQTKITSFKDILYTQYIHYFSWGGRSIVHIIAQSLLLLDPKIGHFINSLAYIGLTLTVYYLSNNSNKTKPSLLLSINLLIWFFQPAYGSTILWITGSANYLWGTLIILLFISIYIKKIKDKKNDLENSHFFKSILTFFSGIIAGWTNENMSIALIFIIALYLFYFKIRMKKIPLWAISGFIGVIIGSTIMIAAPGNYIRMNITLINEHINNSFINLFLTNFKTSVFAYYYYSISPTFILSFIMILYSSYKISNKKKTLFIASSFFMSAIIATLAMTASPIFPGRASFGINTFLFISIGILYSSLNFNNSLIRNLSRVTLIFALLIFSAEYVRSYRVLKSVNEHYNIRVASIMQGKLKGQKDFVLYDRINPENKALHYFELTPDIQNWHNKSYSAYYGINSIRVELNKSDSIK